MRRLDIGVFVCTQMDPENSWIKVLRPLQNAPFCPISASGSNFNSQNTQCIPAVKIIAFPSGA